MKGLSEKQTGKTLIRLLHQKQPDLGLPPVCLGLFDRQLVFKILEHLPYVLLLGNWTTGCQVVCLSAYQ